MKKSNQCHNNPSKNIRKPFMNAYLNRMFMFSSRQVEFIMKIFMKIPKKTEAYEIEFEECIDNGRTIYKCSVCFGSFTEKQLLIDHHYSIHVRKTTNGSIAKEIIFVNSENQVLEESSCVWVFKCRICSTTVASLDEMTDHIASVHDGKKSKYSHGKKINGILECTWGYKCTVCFVEYLTKKQMEEHASLIHKIHEFHHCNICSEYFMKDNLMQHKLLCQVADIKELQKVLTIEEQSLKTIGTETRISYQENVPMSRSTCGNYLSE